MKKILFLLILLSKAFLLGLSLFLLQLVKQARQNRKTAACCCSKNETQLNEGNSYLSYWCTQPDSVRLPELCCPCWIGRRPSWSRLMSHLASFQSNTWYYQALNAQNESFFFIFHTYPSVPLGPWDQHSPPCTCCPPPPSPWFKLLKKNQTLFVPHRHLVACEPDLRAVSIRSVTNLCSNEGTLNPQSMFLQSSVSCPCRRAPLSSVCWRWTGHRVGSKRACGWTSRSGRLPKKCFRCR